MRRWARPPEPVFPPDEAEEERRQAGYDPFPDDAPPAPGPPCDACGCDAGHKPACPVLVETDAVARADPARVASCRAHLPGYDPAAACEEEALAWAEGGFPGWSRHWLAVAGVVRALVEMSGGLPEPPPAEAALDYLNRPCAHGGTPRPGKRELQARLFCDDGDASSL